MTQEQQQLLMLKGIISDLPEEDKMKINAAHSMIKNIVAEYGDNGQIALGLAGAEFAAKD